MSQPLTTDDRFAITASGVTFRYAGTPVLHNVALEVRHSDCFGLLGPNGSGKTTLFRLLSTLLPLQSGQVLIDGVDLKTAPSNVRQKIGVTFQSPALDPRLTVIQNLRCHGEIYGLEHSPARFNLTSLQPKSTIRGLYLAGQDIVTVGVGGALASGMLCATQILKFGMTKQFRAIAKRSHGNLLHETKE